MPPGVHNVSKTTLIGLTVRKGGLESQETAAGSPRLRCGEWEAAYHASDVRFWSKVDRSGECWLWTASCWSTGYGQFSIPGPSGKRRTIGAHVYAFEQVHGPVPEGMEVMHDCDTPRCVRPSHLKAGTHTDNVRDASRKGRLNVPRPAAQKMTDADCEQAVAWVRAGRKQVDVARHFGVSKVQISLLVAGKRRQYRPSLQQQKAS